MKAWIGVDLDGTLAYYDGWKGEHHIGEPIPAMLTRVQQWILQGREVRIFTARLSNPEPQRSLQYIQAWCHQHLGIVLPVTNVKDFGMVELWDDRCVRVLTNKGVRCCES